MSWVRAVGRRVRAAGRWVDNLVLGRDGNRFEHFVMLALAITLLGNGLALTWIQADRSERIKAAFVACQAARDRTIRSSASAVRLADLAEEEGSPRFAAALRELAGAHFDKRENVYKVAPPPPCNEP